MNYYKRIPFTVTAFQYTGNKSAFLTYLGRAHLISVEPLVIINNRDQAQMIQEGEWIINMNGGFIVLSETEFRSEFTPTDAPTSVGPQEPKLNVQWVVNDKAKKGQ